MNWWPYITGLALIIVELCWVVPWYRTVIQVSFVASPLRATLVLGAVMLSAYLVVLGMDALHLLAGIQRLVLAVLFVLSLIIGSRLLLEAQVISIISGLVKLNPGAVLVVFFVLWLWWRGISLAREPVRPLTAWRHFRLGLFLLVAQVFIVTRMSQRTVRFNEAEPAGLGIFVLFLFVGLLAIVFSRISLVGHVQGLRKNPFDRRWLAVTSLIVGITVGGTAIIGSLLAGQYRMVLDWLGDTMRFAIAAILFVVGLPFVLLAYLFGPLIQNLQNTLPTPGPTPFALTPDPFATGQPAIIRPQNIAPTPLWVQLVIFWGFVAVVLLILFKRSGWKIARLREDREEQEILLQKGDARRLLRQAIQDVAHDLGTRLRPIQREQANARIRRIYADLMLLFEEMKQPRKEWQTPIEFLPEMASMLPFSSHELEIITDAYIKVRYGEYPESMDELSVLDAAWQHINQEGQKMKQVIKQAELAQEVLDSKQKSK